MALWFCLRTSRGRKPVRSLADSGGGGDPATWPAIISERTLSREGRCGQARCRKETRLLTRSGGRREVAKEGRPRDARERARRQRLCEHGPRRERLEVGCVPGRWSRAGKKLGPARDAGRVERRGEGDSERGTQVAGPDSARTCEERVELLGRSDGCGAGHGRGAGEVATGVESAGESGRGRRQ